MFRSLLSSILLTGFFLLASHLGADEQPKKEVPKPLPKEVTEAWKKVGVRSGWCEATDQLDFIPAELLKQNESPEAGWLPLFKVENWKEGLFKALPVPKMPFAISIGFTELTDSGMKELAKFDQLAALTLRRTKVTDTGLKELANLKQLKWLDLCTLPVTDAGLKELVNLQQLNWLHLGSTKVTDAGLKEVAKKKQLSRLNLQGLPITDAGLKELAGLAQLTSLDLRETRVTATGVKELQKALPKCKITVK